MTHIGPLSMQMNLSTCEKLNVHLIWVLIHRMYNGKTDAFQSLYEWNEEIHNHDNITKFLIYSSLKPKGIPHPVRT